jgi:hypothetical protein
MINSLHFSMVDESLTRLPQSNTTVLSNSSLIQYIDSLDHTVSSTNLAANFIPTGGPIVQPFRFRCGCSSFLFLWAHLSCRSIPRLPFSLSRQDLPTAALLFLARFLSPSHLSSWRICSLLPSPEMGPTHHPRTGPANHPRRVRSYRHDTRALFDMRSLMAAQPSTSRTADNPSPTPSTAQRVFAIPELFEMILTRLPLQRI